MTKPFDATAFPMPTTVGVTGIAFDLNDGNTAIVELRRDGTYYADANDYDFAAPTAAAMVALLVKYGARYAGVERLNR